MAIFSALGGEFPNVRVASGLYPPTTPGQMPGAEYGADFDLGSGGGSATRYPGTWRIYTENTISTRAVGGGVEYDLRVGVWESVQSRGLYAAFGTAGPDNYGMAGRFPDFANQSGTTPLREDNLVFQTTNNSMVGSGVETICMDAFPLRATGVAAIDLPGVGRLELSAAAQAIGAPLPVNGPTMLHRVDLDASGLRSFFRVPNLSANLTFQAVRVDLATGQVELSRAGEISIFP